MAGKVPTAKKEPPKGRFRRRFAELFVVFAGVMAAFLLNEWASSRRDAGQAALYVDGLLMDLRADSAQLSTLVTQCDSNAQTLLRFLYLPSGIRVSDDSLELYMRLMLTSETFQPRTATYDALKFSGDLSIVSDLSVRKAVVEHYERYKEIHELDEVAGRYWENVQIPFFLDQVDMTRLDIRAYQSWKFKNILRGHVSLLLQKARSYRAALTGVDSVQEALRFYRENN